MYFFFSLYLSLILMWICVHMKWCSILSHVTWPKIDCTCCLFLTKEKSNIYVKANPKDLLSFIIFFAFFFFFEYPEHCRIHIVYLCFLFFASLCQLKTDTISKKIKTKTNNALIFIRDFMGQSFTSHSLLLQPL